MKLSFFFGDIKKIGKHAKLGVHRNAAQGPEERGNIFGGFFRLHSGSIIAGIAMLRMSILGRGIVSQIETAWARIHD